MSVLRLFPRFHVFFALTVWFAACSESRPRAVIPAFYHWQTILALSPAERGYLDSLRCKKLYIKVLDIGRDAATGEIQPYSRAELTDTTGLAKFELIPVVFITNEVFKHIPEEKIEWLAGKVAEALPPPGSFPPEGPGGAELQFDCDWTASTREAFFLFLQKIKAKLPRNTRLSATIRLHQYKFPEKTGVPPVDRGMLMLYNTGDVEDPLGGNSIFNPDDARKYLAGASKRYPLPLDVALPLFSWALVFREGELWKIIPEVPSGELADTSRFAAVPGQRSAFLIRRGTFLAGHYLRPGDRLRVEAITPDLLREAAQLAAKAALADDAAVAFFHLDTVIIHRYPVQLLDSVCQVINFSTKR